MFHVKVYRHQHFVLYIELLPISKITEMLEFVIEIQTDIVTYGQTEL